MKILFITDMHQNIEAIKKIDFSKYDLTLCGGDFVDPANPNFDIAKQIIDILPKDTIIVPGNVDSNPDLLEQISSFNNIHFKKISINQSEMEIDLVGLGSARSLADDFVEYRKYFEEDHSRIWDFYNNSPAKFILQSCGVIVKDDKIDFLPLEECLDKAKNFVSKFASFDEAQATDFFDSIDSLTNGIMLLHSPVRTVLDKLPYLPNIGVVSAKKAIDRLKPRLVLCGHFHENGGIVKLGQTTFFNPGALKDGYYGEIDFTATDVVAKIAKV